MTGTDAIRVPLVQPGLRPELAAVEQRILEERGRVSLLYQVLLNSESIASGWEQMLTAVRNRTSLPDGLRELIILRVAVLNQAPFEFEAHAPIAERAGLGQDKIAAVQVLSVGDVFAPVERLVLALTDAMTRDVVVPDLVFEPLRDHFDAQGLVELVATVAAYNMVSRLLVALHVKH